MSSDQPLSKLKVEGIDDGDLVEPAEDIGLRALVEGDQNYTQGNQLQVFWNDALLFTHIITLVEEMAGVHFYIGKKVIKPGSAKAYYTLADQVGNVVTSPVSNFNVTAAT
jgi:hypothetical protein